MNKIPEEVNLFQAYHNIVNIKASIRFTLPLSFDELCSHFSRQMTCFSKHYGNMLIIKSAIYNYIIFGSKKCFSSTSIKRYHCNITGIPKFELVERSVEVFTKFFETIQQTSFDKVKIDSITSKFNFLSEIDLRNIYSKLKGKDILNKKLNFHSFPSLKVKFAENLGCVQLYSSGKCILLGQKSIFDINRTLKLLSHVLGRKTISE